MAGSTAGVETARSTGFSASHLIDSPRWSSGSQLAAGYYVHQFPVLELENHVQLTPAGFWLHGQLTVRLCISDPDRGVGELVEGSAILMQRRGEAQPTFRA